MQPNLILYNSVNGQTEKICRNIITHMHKQGLACHLQNIHALSHHLHLAEYKSVLFGMPVRYGKHNRQMISFIKNNSSQIQQMPFGLFSVNLTARKADKNSAATNPYIIRLLQEIRLQPQLVGVMAGSLKYPEYQWIDRIMIRLIMKITGGPTDTGVACTEFTNWQQVRQFTQEYISVLKKAEV